MTGGTYNAGTISLTITLPYPPSGLNPNRAGHWAVKRRTGMAYRQVCWVELRKFGGLLRGNSQFRFQFAPPNAIKRDMDNAIASMKGFLDLLSRHTGIDDSKFKIDWPQEFLPPVKNGAVYLEVIG